MIFALWMIWVANGTSASAQERQVDQLDVDALILDRLGRVRDLDQLARGLLRIAERLRLDVSHGLGCDVRDVDQGILEAVTIKHLAAGAARHRAGLLRWQLFASRPQCIFSRGPISLIAPRPKIGLGAGRPQ